MARWEPNAGERFTRAAMELFSERGFDATTVADIAARAGLTERTFFRYFSDKREVLFDGAEQMKKTLVHSVHDAGPEVSALDAVIAACQSVSPMMAERRAFARKRWEIILAHEDLRERELVKLEGLVVALADALRQRGVDALAAEVAAEAGIGLFKVAFSHWMTDTTGRDLAHHVHAAAVGLREVTAASVRGSP